MPGPLPTAQLSYKSDGYALSQGQKNVTTAGTAEAISATANFKYQALIQAKRTNTGFIYIGTSAIDNTDSAGIYLAAGEILQINNQDLADLYIDATTDGEGITYLAWS